MQGWPCSHGHSTKPSPTCEYFSAPSDCCLFMYPFYTGAHRRPQACVSHRHVIRVCMTSVTQKWQVKTVSCYFRATETGTSTGNKRRSTLQRYSGKPTTERRSPKKFTSKHSHKNSRVEVKPPPPCTALKPLHTSLV